LAKVAVQYSEDTFVVYQTLVLRINICGENRHLRQARNRYVQPKKTNDSATLKWKECKTPTLHKIKRGVFANTQAHTKTPHLILPNRTQAHPPPQKMNGLTTIK